VSVQVSRVDVADLDQTTAAELAVIDNAAPLTQRPRWWH
jgi:hypothetical protein